MRQFPTTVRVYTLLHAASYNAILEDSVPLPGLEPTRGWCAATNARIRVTVVRGIAPDNCRYYTYSMCVHWHIPTLPSRLSICRPSKVFILP